MIRTPFIAIVCAALIGGCQHTPHDAPAVLTDASETNISALKSALSSTLDRATIELGAGDPTVDPRIAVLPPPLSEHEDRSPARPTMFDLVIRDGTCIAIQSDTQVETSLPGVTCRAL